MSLIYQVPALLEKHNIKHVVLSPGSRNAPLSISFAQHTHFKKHIIPDERSAAFVALGIAQSTNSTVALVCTSGSAVLNYGPAVAEAFFSNTPLLIITADRPPEWIDQQDGQTIRQENVFGRHVVDAYNLPVDLTHPDSAWEFCRKISEAANAAQAKQGPVHINIPFREPFYPSEKIEFSENLKNITHSKLEVHYPEAFINEFLKKIPADVKILCIAGQNKKDIFLNEYLPKLGIPVISEAISNLNESENNIQKHDLILSALNESDEIKLKPDLLITWGNSIVSKSLKHYLRKHKPLHHWHISTSGVAADTYQSLTANIQASPYDFIQSLNQINYNKEYLKAWQTKESEAIEYVATYFRDKEELTELNAFYTVLRYLPEHASIHIGNSMPIRYVNLLGFPSPRPEYAFCNRGTSGIDGIISTAVGAALANPEQMHIVITGDMSFFYDRNAWWHNYNCSNLKVILFNNHGGGIFRFIDGPKQQEELEEYFVTKQKLSARNLAEEFDLNYFNVTNIDSLKSQLHKVLRPSTQPSIIEIETNGIEDVEAFKLFKQQYKTA
jgi:2-succinyl-5-enolpyruvyl-6-hydroxy-3-cyclohexene-1-carboxylate synthase